MINPIIYTFHIAGFEFSLRWYGVIVMLGVIVGSLMVERVLKNHGENSDSIWDALVWILPIGIIGARLWYVVNATLGGNQVYVENPASIIKVWEGGLHIFGGLLFGGVTLLVYLRQNKLDPWLFLDAAGPAMLIGQGIGRIANFINQELYGPPTTLPWGIPISAEHRLLDFPVSQYPVATTRFHPTFAYEMLWNFAAAGLLLWLSRRYAKNLKPGTIFASWLVLAGLGRFWIELFRPDQPKISTLGVSYTTIFAGLMVITGVVVISARYKKINLPIAEDWEEEYKISTQPNAIEELVEEDEVVEKKKVPRAKKVSKATTKPVVVKKVPAKKPAVRKPVVKNPVPKKKPATRTKKPAL